MSKAVKTVIGVAAAIAIPFAAPVIAGAIGASLGVTAATFGMSATVGSVLGSAAVGAALGGATQAVLGGDVGRGALMGGISGGIGGYATAPTAAAGAAGTAGTTGTAGTAGTGLTTTAATSAAPTTASLGGVGGGGTGISLGSGSLGLQAPTTLGTAGVGGTTAGFGGALAPVDYSLTAGMQFPTTGLNPAASGIGLRLPDPGFADAGISAALSSGTPIDYSLGAYMPPSTGLQAVAANPVTGGTQTITGSGAFQSTSPITSYSGGTYSPALAAGTPTAIGDPSSWINQPTAAQGTAPAATGTAGTTATGATAPATFSDALKARLTDPNALADLTLRAAGMLAGSALAGQGMDQLSPQERQLLQQQTEELKDLRENNIELINQRTRTSCPDCWCPCQARWVAWSNR